MMTAESVAKTSSLKDYRVLFFLKPFPSYIYCILMLFVCLLTQNMLRHRYAGILRKH